MLNSKSPRFPNGVANSSGLVGKYIMDTVGASLGGQIPALENLPLHNEDGAGGAHAYVPWWLYKEQLAGKLGFARGYHIEFGSGRHMPGMGVTSGIEQLTNGSGVAASEQLQEAELVKDGGFLLGRFCPRELFAQPGEVGFE